MKKVMVLTAFMANYLLASGKVDVPVRHKELIVIKSVYGWGRVCKNGRITRYIKEVNNSDAFCLYITNKINDKKKKKGVLYAN